MAHDDARYEVHRQDQFRYIAKSPEWPFGLVVRYTCLLLNVTPVIIVTL